MSHFFPSSLPRSSAGGSGGGAAPTAKSVLKRFWGYDDFRLCQEEVIENTLGKRDSLVVMGTGAGKSMCYQIPPLVLGTTCVVISPLISLMEDQVSALKQRGITACFLGSAQLNHQVKEQAWQGAFSFVYMTPEMAASSAGALQSLHRTKTICLVAIDEAHCVSEWGHDFRPEYRQLGNIRTVLPGVPILALTATATQRVQDDIVRNLGLNGALRKVMTFERTNLEFAVAPKRGGLNEVFGPLVKEKLARKEGNATLIYTLTTRETDEISEHLRKQLGAEGRVATYHGKMSNDQRRHSHHAFLRDDCDIMVATLAYGMGIDKPNVRSIMHYGSPASLEAYYQQAGRAGRDGLPAKCTLFWHHGDMTMQDMIKNAASLSESGRKNYEACLTQVQAYCSTASCRAALLVNYFVGNGEGSLPLGGPCQGGCDNCQARTGGSLVAREVGAEARMLLAAVQGMRGYYGLGKPVSVLRGSKAKGMPAWSMEMKDPHSNELLHGLGKKFSENWWKGLAGLLVGDGHLEFKSMKGAAGSYSAVAITTSGRDLLGRRTQPLLLELPGAMLGEEREARAAAEKEALFEQQRKERGAKGEEESALLRFLQMRRKAVADRLGQVATTLVNEQTLIQIQQRRPETVEQMRAIGAMSVDATFNQYGLELLNTVVDFCSTAVHLKHGNDWRAARPGGQRPGSPTPCGGGDNVFASFAASSICGVRGVSEAAAAAAANVNGEPKNSALACLDRFQAGESLKDIANNREKPIKVDTVMGYITECLAFPGTAERVDCDRLVKEARLTQVLVLKVADAVEEHGAGGVGAVKRVLGDVDYGAIKLVAALMVARAAWFSGAPTDDNGGDNGGGYGVGDGGSGGDGGGAAAMEHETQWDELDLPGHTQNHPAATAAAATAAWLAAPSAPATTLLPRDEPGAWRTTRVAPPAAPAASHQSVAWQGSALGEQAPTARPATAADGAFSAFACAPPRPSPPAPTRSPGSSPGASDPDSPTLPKTAVGGGGGHSGGQPPPATAGGASAARQREAATAAPAGRGAIVVDEEDDDSPVPVVIKRRMGGPPLGPRDGNKRAAVASGGGSTGAPKAVPAAAPVAAAPAALLQAASITPARVLGLLQRSPQTGAALASLTCGQDGGDGVAARAALRGALEGLVNDYEVMRRGPGSDTSSVVDLTDDKVTYHIL